MIIITEPEKRSNSDEVIRGKTNITRQKETRRNKEKIAFRRFLGYRASYGSNGRYRKKTHQFAAGTGTSRATDSVSMNQHLLNGSEIVQGVLFTSHFFVTQFHDIQRFLRKLLVFAMLARQQFVGLLHLKLLLLLLLLLLKLLLLLLLQLKFLLSLFAFASTFQLSLTFLLGPVSTNLKYERTDKNYSGACTCLWKREEERREIKGWPEFDAVTFTSDMVSSSVL